MYRSGAHGPPNHIGQPHEQNILQAQQRQAALPPSHRQSQNPQNSIPNPSQSSNSNPSSRQPQQQQPQQQQQQSQLVQIPSNHSLIVPSTSNANVISSSFGQHNIGLAEKIKIFEALKADTESVEKELSHLRKESDKYNNDSEFSSRSPRLVKRQKIGKGGAPPKDLDNSFDRGLLDPKFLLGRDASLILPFPPPLSFLSQTDERSCHARSPVKIKSSRGSKPRISKIRDFDPLLIITLNFITHSRSSHRQHDRTPSTFRSTQRRLYEESFRIRKFNHDSQTRK
jgi:hypothetical protein